MVLAFADDMKKLAENISASYNLRIGTIKDIKRDTNVLLKDTQGLMNKFHHNRQEMSEELRSELADFVKQLHGDVEKMMRETHVLLQTFKTDFEKMSHELHSMLSGYYKGEIKKPVHDMLGKYHNQMTALANDFHKAHEAWMSLSRAMSAAKEGLKTAPEAESPKTAPGKKRKYSRRK